MPRRRTVGLLVAALGAAAMLASCTSSTWDTSEINNPVSTTIKQYSRDEAGVVGSLAAYLGGPIRDLNQWTAPESEATCAAKRLTDRLTAERLLTLGYDPQKPTVALAYEPAERVSAVNILVGCIDFSQAILELFSSYQKLSIPASSCMAQGFDRLGLVRDLATGLVNGAEPDPFANDNKFAKGVAQLAGECLEEGDLNPSAPLAPTPNGVDLNTTTTSTTPIGKDGSGDLDGIVPGGPLDTTEK